MVYGERLQRTKAWYQARLGKVTASQFAVVMTKPRSKAAQARGELSQSAHSYLTELLGERLTGKPASFGSSAATSWGIQFEGDAASTYAFETGQALTPVGFVDHPSEPLVGGSPDALLGEDGILEIKCPFTSRIQVQTLLANAMPSEHVAQVQGNLWVTGRSFADFVSYDPRMTGAHQLFVHRVERDEEVIKEISDSVLDFRDTLVEKLKELGAYDTAAA